MKKFVLCRLGDRYYLADKRSGRLLKVIGYTGSAENYEKALKFVDDKNKGL